MRGSISDESRAKIINDAKNCYREREVHALRRNARHDSRLNGRVQEVAPQRNFSGVWTKADTFRDIHRLFVVFLFSSRLSIVNLDDADLGIPEKPFR